jgi:hypothetical protein
MTLIEQINAALDKKMTVTVATYGRVINIKSKHRAAWSNVGFEFFKTDSTGAPVMIEGQSKGKPRYACISGARVTAA